jgi:excisionase family DNA binding protein
VAEPHYNASTGLQTASLAKMDSDCAELASRISVDQIPYTIAWLLVKFWSESQDSNASRQAYSARDADKFLTAGELADRLGVPESWVRTEERAKRIPSVRLGKYVRFRWPDVDRALSAKAR